MTKKAKNKGGRPGTITKDVIAKLEEAFSIGSPKTVACRYAGVSEEALYRYLVKYPEYRKRIKQLQELTGYAARKTLNNAIKEGDAKSAIEYLKRKYKNEFSEKTEQAHSGELHSNTKMSEFMAIKKATKEKLEELRKQVIDG
jgi:hypothetical protein